MKLLITGSNEPLAKSIKHFFEKKGDQVTLILPQKKEPTDLSYEEIDQNGLPECDGVLSLPQRIILENRLGTTHFEKEFKSTRIEPTMRVKQWIQASKMPPSVWISFSSVGCYPKEKAQVYKEKDPIGEDPTAKLVQQWEEAASLTEGSKTRVVIARIGLLISRHSGLLEKIYPFFRFGLGTIMGSGDEAFPWIYQKDLYWFLDFALKNNFVNGVYNTVAPQLITSKDFSLALGQVMRKPVVFKFPRTFFYKRLGDTAEVVFAKSKVFPSRLLKSGFEFRYPAIYPTLVDCLNKGSHF